MRDSQSDRPAEDSGLRFERVPCPLCGGVETTLRLRAPDYFCGVPGQFSFERCERCGHVFLNPRPTRETIGLAYPDDYGPHRVASPAVDDPTAIASEDVSSVKPTPRRPWYARQPFRSIPGLRALYRFLTDQHAEFVPPIEGSRVAVEFGFGSGAFLRRLLAEGWDARGYDASDVAVERARTQRLPVEQATVEEIVLSNASLDAVFAWMTLEHLHDVRGALAKVRKALKPGGWFCFSVPNFGCWEPRAFGRHWLGYDAPRHLHQFTSAILRRILREAGFDSVRIVHQRNLRYVYGSLGTKLLDRNPRSRLGGWLMRSYRTELPLGVQLLIAPLAIALAGMRQSGRITVVARVDGVPSRDETP